MMNEPMNRFGALAGACLCALAIAFAFAAPKADALPVGIVLQTTTEQTVGVDATLNHPCNAAEMVKVSGTTHVRTVTYVDGNGSARVEVAADMSHVAGQNLTNGTTYTASGTAMGQASLGLLPASAVVTVSTVLTGSNGETITLFLDLKVDASTNGATIVQVTNVRLGC